MATTRTLTAEQAGPITVDAELLGLGGIVTVRTQSTIKNAEITIRTADDSGALADAVRAAALQWDPRGSLVARVQGKGSGGNGFSQTVITGGRGRRVTQVVSGNSGSTVIMSGGNISVDNGTVIVNGHVISGSANTVIIGGSSVEIEAVLPEGSSVIGRTDSADVAADGTFTAIAGTTQSGDIRVQGTSEQVTAQTQSGDVTIGNAPNIVVKTQSGDVGLGRTDVVEAHTMSGDITIKDFGGTAKLKTMSGDIDVHATAGGDIDASTMSGDIEVTATQAALDDALDVRPHTMSGRIRVPHRQNSSSGPRRRR
ncbi:DUF4097 domain-containing protein [Streptomyces sp. NPDC056053]|uniref:DUF4097 family beta strand repeat-containing protein n=1 Tax=Streptomyces sp. NPDC056053 TaxID=3345696 RepID=UPI0035E20879